MLRNPRAVVTSFLRYKASSTAHGERLLDLRHTRRSYQDLSALHPSRDRPCGAPGVIRYEDLIAHPLSTLQQVARKLGIESAPQMLEARGSSESEFFEGTSKRAEPFRNGKRAHLERSIRRCPTTGRAR
jgi:hypothetical protein